ncbi:uncharacterized protein ColSpa_08258 [Colletotrichum spaethianum]|uniref:Uncharacterized protein n=1 Tax=Colletotrichum spaethianum TaxID=700344 RepID=A0AA37UQ41_9PEZI|nr:uncharacterized protein ColSpa_08258 [Colletotrichum spaethianum]GKT48077.1 hypothetical protein ColSpa_08258 [Colletotrichum spaethianum]
MDDFFTPVSKTYLKVRPEEPLLQESEPSKKPTQIVQHSSDVTTVEAVLESLKSQPDYDSLIAVLNSLDHGTIAATGFKVARPSPEAAQVIQCLVSEIVPNYWPLLKEEASEKSSIRDAGSQPDLELLLRCLRNVTGLNAVITRMKALIQESKASAKDVKRPDLVLNLSVLLEVCSAVLSKDEHLAALWTASSSGLDSTARRRPMAHEFTALIAGGRLISVAAEANAIANPEMTARNNLWIADGQQYSKWLGRSIIYWAQSDISSEDAKLCSEVFTRSLRLGYPGKPQILQAIRSRTDPLKFLQMA